MRDTRKNKNNFSLLKILMYVYIFFCLLFASLNYAVAPKADPHLQRILTSLWHFYENGFKVIFIIITSLLTISILKSQQHSQMRKRNLIALTISALIIHVILPYILQNQELYFFSMPLPWSSMPLQLLSSDSEYYRESIVTFSQKGIFYSLLFFIGITLVIIIGTIIMGRRWQCSFLCMFNGFAGEIFSLTGSSKKKGRGDSIHKYVRVGYLVIALLFMMYWVLVVLRIPISTHSEVIASFEVVKYLVFELFFMMICWVVISPRGYCYVCPVGSTLSLLSKVTKQRILTTETSCIGCNRCNDICPMNIDISSKAKIGADVINSLCVGCGHCIDACPKRTLRYTTDVLEVFH